MMYRHLFSALFLLYAHLANTQTKDCVIPPSLDAFKAQQSWQSGTKQTSSIAVPIVANLNPQKDSMPEIIVCARSSNNGLSSNQIEIYRGDGSNKNAPMRLDIPGRFANYPPPGPVIGDINNDGSPELLMACYDRRIRVFINYQENLINPMTLWITSPANQPLATSTTRLSLADFDGDGIPEVYAGSDIYKFNFSNPIAPALNRVLTGQTFTGRSSYNNYNTGSCSPVAVDILSVADCNGDPDCAGLELVAGPMIYSVDVETADGDGIQMKAKRDLNQMQTADKYADGYTAIGDVDLDGILDIVVGGQKTNGNVRGIYVWNKDKLLMFGQFPNNSTSGGIACIANVYKDEGGGPDFPEILICSSRNFICYNLNAAKITPLKPFWWYLPTTDVSGWTGATVFDFNGDGLFEVVYRDEDYLRILYGGQAPFPAGVDAERNWFRTACKSGTSDEYAVIADVDNDGQTEIAVTGNPTINNNFTGSLWVFESAGSPWRPSRSLWNQYNYFSVHVNDDLRTPAVQMPNHHLEHPVAGNGKRPFNTFLAQHSLDEDFQGIPLPDATAQMEKSYCAKDSFVVQVKFCNQGIKTLNPGTPIAIYTNDPTTTNAVLFGPIRKIDVELKPDSCHTMNIKLPKNIGKYYGMVNDNGSKTRPYALEFSNPLSDVPECNWLNNQFIFDLQNNQPKLNLGTDIAICTDTAVTFEPGTGFIHFQWQDSSTTNTFRATKPGIYWVEAKDFCENILRDTIIIARLESPLVNTSVNDVSCFGKNDGHIKVDLTGGSPGFAYQWSTLKTGPTIDDLTPGVYTLTLTYADGKCSQTIEYQIVEPQEILLDATSSRSDCKGGLGGSIDLNVQNGFTPFLYNWSNNSSVEDPQNLTSGNYTVTVTDAKGCKQTFEQTVEERPAITLLLNTQNARCATSKDGSADATPSNGTPPFQYLWSNGEKTQQITGIPSGIYTLTITDSSGCTETAIAQVQAPLPLISKGISELPSCPDEANGSATFLGAAQGTPPYAFQWSDGSTTMTLSNLQTGNYPLILTDANGCETMDTAHVVAFEPPTTNTIIYPITCFGKNDGFIKVLPTGGSPGYGFQWSNQKNSSIIENLTAGVYKLTLTYADGKCAQTFDYQIIEPKAILLDAISTPADCKGGAGGSIDLNVQHGIAPLVYRWSNNSSVEDPKNLKSGSYTVTVIDANGCKQTFEKTVDERPFIALNISAQNTLCADSKDGSATVTPSKGSPPFDILWSNGEKTEQINGLPVGIYTATVSDASGCTEVASLSVQSPLPLLSKGISEESACPGLANGAATFLGAAQGTPPYTLRWSDGTTTATLNNLPTGKYTLTITDANGCETTDTAYVTAYMPPSSTAATRDVSCFGKNDGKIEVALSGGSPGFGFLWSNQKNTPGIEKLAPGTYTLTLTYASGKCVQISDYQVNEPSKIEISTQKTVDPNCFSGTNGSIDVDTKGGVSPYRFEWSNGQKTKDIKALAAGTYTVTVTDTKDCTLSIPFVLFQPEAISTTATISADTCEKGNGSAQALATGGTKPYQITWSNGQSGSQITALKAGAYMLTLSDAKGCTAIQPIQVPAYGKVPILSAEAGKITCFSPEIEVNALSDQQNLNYQWAGPSGALSNKKSQLVSVSGTYHITATNTFGCSSTAQVLVSEDKMPPTAEAGPVKVRVSCKETLFFLDASASSKGAGFENRWMAKGMDTFALKVQVAKPGYYVHAVRNLLNGCKSSDTILVEWDEPIKAKIEIEPILCHGGKEGSVAIVHLSGGSPPFVYALDNQSFNTKNLYANLFAGQYKVAMHDNFGCNWETQVTLTDPPLLRVNLTTKDTVIELGQYVKLNAAVTPKSALLSSIEWEPQGLSYTANSLTQKIKPEESISFLVRVTDQYGCVAEDMVKVKVNNFNIYVPNVILPDSDINGGFTIFAASGITEISYLQIYDRWGNQVFERRDFLPNDIRIGWDGRFRNQDVGAGVYVWQAAVRLSNDKILFLKGDVTVVR